MSTPKQKANLKPWKKGQSGNPIGRPGKAAAFGEALKAFAENDVGLPALIRRLYREDIKTFLAYAYGKPIETRVELTGEEIRGVPSDVLEVLRRRFVDTVNGN